MPSLYVDEIYRFFPILDHEREFIEIEAREKQVWAQCQSQLHLVDDCLPVLDHQHLLIKLDE